MTGPRGILRGPVSSPTDTIDGHGPEQVTILPWSTSTDTIDGHGPEQAPRSWKRRYDTPSVETLTPRAWKRHEKAYR